MTGEDRKNSLSEFLVDYFHRCGFAIRDENGHWGEVAKSDCNLVAKDILNFIEKLEESS